MSTIVSRESKLPRQPKPPEKPLMPYMRYSRKVWEKVKNSNPNLKLWEVGKIIGQMWRELSEEEKNAFVEEYEAEKSQYSEQLRQYHTSPAYQSWLAAKERAERYMEEENDRKSRRIKDSLSIPPDLRESYMLDDNEEEFDEAFSLKHVSAARFHRNHRLMQEILSDTKLPDYCSLITASRLNMMKMQVEQLSNHKRILTQEIESCESKHESKIRKLSEDSGAFYDEYRKVVSEWPTISESQFSNMIVKAKIDLTREEEERKEKQAAEIEAAKKRQQIKEQKEQEALEKKALEQQAAADAAREMEANKALEDNSQNKKVEDPQTGNPHQPTPGNNQGNKFANNSQPQTNPPPPPIYQPHNQHPQVPTSQQMNNSLAQNTHPYPPNQQIPPPWAHGQMPPQQPGYPMGQMAGHGNPYAGYLPQQMSRMPGMPPMMAGGHMPPAGMSPMQIYHHQQSQQHGPGGPPHPSQWNQPPMPGQPYGHYPPSNGPPYYPGHHMPPYGGANQSGGMPPTSQPNPQNPSTPSPAPNSQPPRMQGMPMMQHGMAHGQNPSMPPVPPSPHQQHQGGANPPPTHHMYPQDPHQHHQSHHHPHHNPNYPPHPSQQQHPGPPSNPWANHMPPGMYPHPGAAMKSPYPPGYPLPNQMPPNHQMMPHAMQNNTPLPPQPQQQQIAPPPQNTQQDSK